MKLVDNSPDEIKDLLAEALDAGRERRFLTKYPHLKKKSLKIFI